MGIDGTKTATRDDDTLATTASGDSDKNIEQTAQTQTGMHDNRSQPRGEMLTREQYADAMRAVGSPISRDTNQDSLEAPEGVTPGYPERQARETADHHPAEPRDRETYADEIRAEHSTGEDREGDQPGGLVFDTDQNAASDQDQQGTGPQPETITFENKDIEVTHNAADGLWIEGLPGEPPTRIGDLISSPEDPAQGRAEKFRKEFTKEAEDITDTSGKWADYFQEILDNPPPTHSMTHSRPPETATAGPEHGISAGHGAEALLTLTIVGTAALHKLREHWQRAWDH